MVFESCLVDKTVNILCNYCNKREVGMFQGYKYIDL